jgi:hypothetical protein
MIHGCVCDLPWAGFDCSLRECPRGDDPLTGQQHDAVQLVECTTTYHAQWIKIFSSNGTLSSGGIG